MEFNEIKELMHLFQESDCSTLKLQQGDFKIRLKKSVIKKAVSEAEVKNEVEIVEKKEAENNECIVKAPLVGIYYDSPSPEADTYVSLGATVKKGQVLCLIEAMKMMNEVVAPKSGRIEKIFLNNQDIVEFEAPLFAIGETDV